MRALAYLLAGMVWLLPSQGVRADWSAPIGIQVDGGFDHIQIRMDPAHQFSPIAFGTAMGFYQDENGDPDLNNWDFRGFSWSQQFINPARNFAVSQGPSVDDNWLTFPIYVSGNPEVHTPSFHLQVYSGPSLVRNLDIYYVGGEGHPSGPESWLSLPGTWGNTTRLYPYFFPGDANYDAAVDLLDIINHWQPNYTGFGGTGMTWEQGDWNGDGSVDLLDIIEAWQQYYTGPITGPPPLAERLDVNWEYSTMAVSIPEPAALGLLLTAGVLLTLRRRMRRRIEP